MGTKKMPYVPVVWSETNDIYDLDMERADGTNAVWKWAAERLAASKRLTDAECASEYHRMCHEFDIAKYGLERDPYPGTLNDCDDIGERIDTWYRFATLPHAHDEFRR